MCSLCLKEVKINVYFYSLIGCLSNGEQKKAPQNEGPELLKKVLYRFKGQATFLQP